MQWILDHLDDIGALALQHVYLAGLPLVIGLVLALAIGWGAVRVPWLKGAVLAISGLLYTIPSLALFVRVNVIVAMTVYTVALLVRTVVDGLSSVPDDVIASARAMGYKPLRRFFGVELPLAVPVIAAGLRVAAVSNVSIVSVASLVGISQLGDLLVDGYNRDIPGELVAGILGCVLLALLFDVVIRAVERVLTPWVRVRQGRAA
jgi:osmoprotectant transport system permease protein